ncbi:NAD(P)/FAD-dependent oxidoreductase [Sphaerospermopsis aphanizomenoides BCCUSP55]|uniref:NAD(P)/FAD-dependent oxidoreductase n=1 Tax=Sphaerospermopsis aphanizomenoides TaxID=459663 RepID=UPI001907C06A|nr:NAD(P)/FAD-dependent oxidoreductase [Sphaerospermopsis aphanizomenoides]MBK1988662.1 NAD(P)/FAD-dependent oxidoreductase [Sphaerospermopsis aphanizomenoides BCCUSP55]
MLPLQIVVIGGGAAGFFGAIACAEANPQAQVTVIEASRQPLAKVLISGGGRCNVTHACFAAEELVQNYPRGGKALRGAFTRFQPLDTVAWFAAHGVNLKTEADGRMFPITDRSETIAESLIKAVAIADVELSIGTPVISVNRKNEGFEIVLKSGETLDCHRLLLATGSNLIGHKIARELGHQIETPVPSLFTFNIPEPKFRALAGISVNPVNIRLAVAGKNPLQQTGPLLITHWGVSGPAVLKLSAWGARILHETRYQGKLYINWLPNLPQAEVRQRLLNVKQEWGKKAIALHRGVDLPHRLWQYLIARIGITTEDRWAEISSKTLNQLVQEISQGEYLINGKGAFKEEFVTCGGVNLKEVNFKTMESKLVPGLYFAGEILDIDGITGGFNFQSAWTTAYLAGQNMAV